MKRAYVQTRNAGAFSSAMKFVCQAQPEEEKMMLVTGAPGRGKTSAFEWYHANFDSVSLVVMRAWKNNFRDLLRHLVKEFGVKPAHGAGALMDQCLDLFREDPKPILIDEADRLDITTVEVLRDIHDLIRVPVVLIGVTEISETILRSQALWRRFTQAVRFEPLLPVEIPGILEQLCEAPLSEEAVERVVAECTMFGDVKRYILHAEREWRGRSGKVPASVVDAFKARIIKGRAHGARRQRALHPAAASEAVRSASARG